MSGTFLEISNIIALKTSGDEENLKKYCVDHLALYLNMNVETLNQLLSRIDHNREFALKERSLGATLIISNNTQNRGGLAIQSCHQIFNFI